MQFIDKRFKRYVNRKKKKKGMEYFHNLRPYMSRSSAKNSGMKGHPPSMYIYVLLSTGTMTEREIKHILFKIQR